MYGEVLFVLGVSSECMLFLYSFFLHFNSFIDIMHMPYKSPIYSVQFNDLWYIQSHATIITILKHFHHPKKNPQTFALAQS